MEKIDESSSSKSEGESEKSNLTFKIIVLGDPGVGKSSLLGRATKNIFNAEYQTTVGFEFLTFTEKIGEKNVKLQIWDTCGQETYKSLISNFYRNASLAMLIYSIDSRESFNNIIKWLKEIKLQSNPDIKVVLIGNKADLENKRQVTIEEGNKFKEENEILFFQEASAKSGINSKEIFHEAAKILYDEYIIFLKKARNTSLTKLNESSFNSSKLKSFYEPRKKRKKCC
jgi:Ras-related protein Rab-2A